MDFKLEICVSSIQSAINAERAGAHRVELCDNLWEGGTTPSVGLLEIVCENLAIKVFPIIRPRGGGFVYSDLEFQAMKRNILHAKRAGAQGIVSGILLSNGTIDSIRTSELVEQTSPLPFTFHRAFDLTTDPMESMEQLIEIGVQRILTSGQKNDVIQGLDMLKELSNQAGGRIIVMPGGGLRLDNIHQVAKETNCVEFHMTAQKYVHEQFEMIHKIELNGSSDIPEDQQAIADIETIEKVIKQLNEMD